MSTKRPVLRTAPWLALLAAGWGGLLQAGTICVTPTGTDLAGANWNTPTSLTNALIIGKSNDVIWLAQGTYTNSATFTVASNGISLYGGFTNGGSLVDRDWNAYPTILDGKGQNLRVVTVSGAGVVLDGLVISNSYGTAAGGISKTTAGALTLANCRLVNHEGRAASMKGIGGYFNAGSVLMTNCAVAGNTISGGTAYSGTGFGIYSSGANLQLVDCLFTNNYGAAWDTRSSVGVALYFDNGTLNALRTDFIGNAAEASHNGGGGAVYLGSSATLSASFSNCVFQGNVAKYYTGDNPGYGGALWADLAANTTATVANCAFTGNINSNGNGGAIYVGNGTLNVRFTDFIGNTAIIPAAASGGGAVYMSSGAGLSATFGNCVFRGNTAPCSAYPGNGGALWVSMAAGKIATVANCTFKDNVSSAAGGAICLSQGTLNLKNCILWTNRVTGTGLPGYEISRSGGTLNGAYSSLSGLTSPYVAGSVNFANCWQGDPLFAGQTDLHLQSPAGRWDPVTKTFVTTDSAYSPCIDAGDPADPVGSELSENGGRIDVGAYGGTAEASKSPSPAGPQVTNRAPLTNDYTQMMLRGELTNSAPVIATVWICYGTNSVAGETTNGWGTVTMICPPQQTGTVFSILTPHLLTNATYYYRAFASNAYGVSWAPVEQFTTGAEYPPLWGVGGGTNVIHVRLGAVGEADGRDWYNAFTSIASAVAAIGGTRASIWIAGGAYTEGAVITIATNATIVGGFAGTETDAAQRNWTANPTVLDGQDQNRRGVAVTGTNVTLDGLIVSNSYGAAAGGISKTGAGNLTLANCRLVNHEGRTASMMGLGGYFTAGSVLMTNCVVAGNTISGSSASSGKGFGIYSSGANLQLVDCLFTNNSGDVGDTRAARGLGMYFDNGTLSALHTDFIGNTGGASHGGGGAAVYLGGSATLMVFSNCAFRGNVAQYSATYPSLAYGGAMWADLAAGKTITVANCTFSGNSCSNGNGGAIYVGNGTLNAFRTEFIGNSARIFSSTPASGGGAVYLSSGAGLSATFSNCVFRANTAPGSTYPGYGGALWANMAAASTATAVNCSLAYNVSSNGGGGIYLSAGTLNLKNSILWTNRVSGVGLLGHEISRAGGTLNGAYSLLTGLASPYVDGSVTLSNCREGDPLFASSTDLHLQSPAGRWDPVAKAFVTTDSVYSPCVDAGAPSDSIGDEPPDNGNIRIDMGAYGGTAEASKSPLPVPPQIADRGATVSYHRAFVSAELTNNTFVSANVYLCCGTNDAGTTTNGWGTVMFAGERQTGVVFSVWTPALVPATTYFYRWYAVNNDGTDMTAPATFLTGVIPPGGGTNVIHVKRDAAGAADGSDWFNAYTTVAAGANAAGGARTNIWIAGGVYTEGAVITIGTDVTVLGGFAGTETAAAQRNWLANPTVLDGQDQNRRGVAVTGTNVTLDGLIVSNSYGSAAGGISKTGAGNLTLANCRLVNHEGRTTSMMGLGGYFTAGSVLMTNCVVAGNTISGDAAYYGKGFGIYSSGANLQLVDCLFTNNYGDAWETRVTMGLALYFDNGTLNVLRTDFIGNTGGATHGGGGAGVYLGNSATLPVFSNCVFRGNVAVYDSRLTSGYGGAIWADLTAGRTVTVANCTFTGNTNANGNGGAIYVSGGTLVLKNSILWTNAVRSGYSGSEIYAINATCFVTNSYSCFTGTNAPFVVAASSAVIAWGNGVITYDPLYASAIDVHLKSKAGRWNPATSAWVNDPVTSPCLDAGDPTDPVGLEPMPNGHRIDMGAYGGTAQASKTLPRGTIVVFK